MDKYELFRIIEMPDGAAETVRKIDGMLAEDPGFADGLSRARDDFYSGADVKPTLAELAGRIGVNEYELALAFFASCAGEAERRMTAQGHGIKVFTDSMRDLTIWAKMCHGYAGVWGIREFDWLARTLRAELWRLGRLQFEYETYNYADFSFGGHSVHTGDRVINVHIPADGPFPADARLASYKQARDHLGLDTFICDSWLLYPPQEKYLDPTSNIVSFMHEYHIVKSSRAWSLRNLRYLFGDMDEYDVAALPRDTRLRRAFMKMIEETGDIGWGVGVLFFDGERIE